jgi:hypothetical protein
MALKTSSPNIGSNKVVYVHCPNCSKMYRMVDEEGNPDGLPSTCKRCGCPMDNSPEGKKAQQWMDTQADGAYDPAIASFGRQMRGEPDEVQSDY